MKIGKLGQHCGECGVIDYCGPPFGYCICTDERFINVDEDTYSQIADGTPVADGTPESKPYEACIGCEDYDHCERCEHDDLARDSLCNQIADYVESTLEKLARKDGE